MKHSFSAAIILILFCTFGATAGGKSVRSADPALLGTALRFDGATTYVDVSSVITLNSSAVTGELWINVSSLVGDWQVIFANWGSGSSGQFHFAIDPGNFLDLVVTNDVDAAFAIADPDPFPTGVWQHVAFTVADHTMRLFRNGTQVAEGTYTGNPKTSFTHTYIGAKPNDDGSQYVYPVQAEIDEVVLWGTGRDPAQIAVDMDTIYTSVPGGVTGYWHFNEGAGSTTANEVNGSGSPLVNFTFDASSGWVASTIPVSPLPVQLSLFTAGMRGGGDVLLEWTTLSETNNFGFNVQRSPDLPMNFKALSGGFVQGHGTTLETRHYSYTDATVGPGKWWYRLQQIDLDGAVHYTEAVKVENIPAVNGERVPSAFSLAQNYPNPFNPSTTIVVALPRDASVSLAVYNALGQKVAQLADGMMTAGYHEVVFDASNLASGPYFYRLKAGTFMATKRFLLVR